MVVTIESEEKTKMLKKEKYKKKNSSSKRLLQEIISLGGDKTDLDLIRDVLSGSENEDNDEKEDIKLEDKKYFPKIDEKSLEKDLAVFVKALDIKPPNINSSDESCEEENLQDQDEKKPLTKKEKKKLRKERLKEAQEFEKQQTSTGVDLSKISSEFLQDIDLNNPDPASSGNLDDLSKARLGKEREGDVRNMVDDILQGIEPKENHEYGNDLLFESDSNLWYEISLEELQAVPNHDPALVPQMYSKAEALWKVDVAKYEKIRKQKSKASRDFISTVLKNGTVTDKVSALTLLVQESPVHNLEYFRQHLLHMAKKKSRREAILAIDSVKDLLLNNILPERKLKYFVDQPCLNKKVSDSHLICWYFEDSLKKAYFEFLQVLEELSKDVLVHVKSKVLSCIFELLCAKPEQEENLLTLLVNKLGDLDKKVASKAAHLLCQLLLQHPAMKNVILKEVERLLLRPNIGERARYYAITFLNQIILTKAESDVITANSLIHLYFTIFTALIKSMKVEKLPVKKDRSKSKDMQKNIKEAALIEIDSLNSKMMSALLTGVNRAFPYSKLESSVFDDHLNTLFQICHLASFNTAIQALSLIFQVQTIKKDLSDRFFRVLYESLFDRRLHDASKQAMYLNLLYRALKSDDSISRIRAFVKRLCQSISIANVSLICGSLFLLSELLNQKPKLWTIITEKNTNTNEDEVYDGKKRDPRFAYADRTVLWELIPFTHHFHPTVSLYAKTILSGNALTVPKDATNYDPLLNHTLARFLERFVYKAPKKVKSLHHGNSLMQPRGTTNLLVTGGRRKQNAIYEDLENDGVITALDDAPVNMKKWKSESDVAADELFYYKYFRELKGHREEKSQKEPSQELHDFESNIEDMEEDEIWEAMSRSKGFDKAALEIDEDDLDLEMEDLPSDFENKSGSNSEYSDIEENDFENEMESINSGNDENVLDDEQDEDSDTDHPGAELDFSTFLEEEEISDSELTIMNSSTSKAKGLKKIPKQLQKLSSIASKLGYEGEYFDEAKNLNDFASADDFKALIDHSSEVSDDNDLLTTQPKRKSAKNSFKMRNPKKVKKIA